MQSPWIFPQLTNKAVAQLPIHETEYPEEDGGPEGDSSPNEHCR